MVIVIGGFQLLVGERRLRRENRVALAAPTANPTLPLNQEKTA
jgi:iron(III) transport system permease protein